MAGQLQETQDQRSQTRYKTQKGRQGQGVAVDRMGNENRNELKKRASQQQAQPADGHEVNKDKGLRCGKGGGRIAIAQGHHAFRRQQGCQRRCEKG
jgi:hypothetical protein